eukprot:720752-Rhodomonas_salina.2
MWFPGSRRNQTQETTSTCTVGGRRPDSIQSANSASVKSWTGPGALRASARWYLTSDSIGRWILRTGTLVPGGSRMGLCTPCVGIVLVRGGWETTGMAYPERCSILYCPYTKTSVLFLICTVDDVQKTACFLVFDFGTLFSETGTTMSKGMVHGREKGRFRIAGYLAR